MLTDTEIKALKAKDKPYQVADRDGLYLEVYPTGAKIWRWRYTLPNGQRERVTLKPHYPDLGLKAARAKRDELAKDAAAGKSPAKEKRLQRKALAESTTVEEFAGRYLREVVAKDRKDDTTVRRRIEREILPAIGAKAVRDVTADDVRALVFGKKAQGHDAAAADLRGVLKRLLDYAAACGLIAANPVLLLPVRQVFKAKARDRALSQGEVGIFLRAVYASNMRRQFKLALHLALITLCRKGELLAAKWADVDFEAGTWSIPAENSKTGAPRLVYLSRQAAELFRELHSLAGGSAFVLPGRGHPEQPFAHNGMNQALKVAMQGEPVPAFTVHDLRRTASTLLHEAGFPADVIEKALGHEIGGVRGVYNRAEYGPQRREMLQAWADSVDGLIGAGNVYLLARRA